MQMDEGEGDLIYPRGIYRQGDIDKMIWNEPDLNDIEDFAEEKFGGLST